MEAFSVETTNAAFEPLSDSIHFLSLKTTSSVCSPASYQIMNNSEANVKEIESKRCRIALLIAHDNSNVSVVHSNIVIIL